MPSPFPDLPIITPPDGARMSTAEKYGGMFYLGLGGLVVLVMLLVGFVWGVAANWSVWTDVYVLHDRSRPEAERSAAAERLAADPRPNQRQRWDMIMRSDLPAGARTALAGSLTAEATSADPAGYARTVAESEGWSDRLRALLVRPMAYAVNLGVDFPEEPLVKLKLGVGPFARTWATYVLAVRQGGSPAALRDLEAEAAGTGPSAGVARALAESLAEPGSGRAAKLDEATRRTLADAPPGA